MNKGINIPSVPFVKPKAEDILRELAQAKAEIERLREVVDRMQQLVSPYGMACRRMGEANAQEGSAWRDHYDKVCEIGAELAALAESAEAVKEGE